MQKILYLLLLFPILVIGQTQTENYIKSTTYKVSTSDGITATDGTTVTSDKTAINVTYVDGLGRPIQQKAYRQSPSGKDIITHIEYDELGRQSKEYLPYLNGSSSMEFDANGHLNVEAFYANPTVTATGNSNFEATSNAYSRKFYDFSPLGKVLKQSAPGNDWIGHESDDNDKTLKYSYETNVSGDQIRRFGASAGTLITSGAFYEPNMLSKTITKNENWVSGKINTTEEFKDSLGRIILKRIYISETSIYDTYYVYDTYGNLSFVIPPKAADIITNVIQVQQPYTYTQNISINDLLISANGSSLGSTASISVKIENSILTLKFDGTVPNFYIDITKSFTINSLYPIPNMVISPYLFNGPPRYTAYIEDNKLKFSQNYANVPPITDIRQTASVALDSNIFANETVSVIVINPETVESLCYQYKYDPKLRLIEKKIPGKEWEYIVYDKLDRAILTQDGNLRAQSKWLFTKYDNFGRVAYTGIWNSSLTRAQVQTEVTNQATPVWSETKQAIAATIGSALFPASLYYTNSAYPNVSANMEILTVNYYDNYVFDLQGLVSEASYLVTPATNVKSLPTGSKIRILGTNNWIYSVSYYDSKDRVIFSASKNDYLGTTDKVKSKLDFIGTVLETESRHLKGSSTLLIVDRFTYDSAGRLLTQKQSINTQAEQLIAKNSYDELGTLIKKQVGNTEVSSLQTIDYAYNIRGWLKDINDISRTGNDLFSYNINYQQNNSPYISGNNAGKPLYNGNISMVNWNTDNNSPGMRAYSYMYDNLNRYTYSQYFENENINNKYTESITYDKNGNIMRLARTAQNTTTPTTLQSIDNLTYKYTGNQLLSVTDAYGLTPAGAMGFTDNNTVGDDYGYDSNGNMNADKNKNITLISYNHLNLPIKIIFNNADIGTASPKVIEYKYDASGAKIEKKVTELTTITTTQYAGNYSYLNGTLQFFPHSEGYVSNIGGTYKYVFQYKDHLGNVRLSYADSDGNGSITGASSELFYSGFENSGWESASDPYHYGGAVTYDTTRKHSGNASGRIDTPPANQERYVQTNTRIPVSNTVPTQYVFSGWVYCDDNMLSADILLIEYKAGETLYNTRAEELRTYSTRRWVYIEKLVTVQPDIVELALRVDNNGGGLVWFDDVNLRKVNTTNEIVEENNYYPFGMKHAYGNYQPGNNANVNAQKYKYNGKELQDELALNLYDYGARNYDPTLCRWSTMDGKGELYFNTSPYVYASNTPIQAIDPDGNLVIFISGMHGGSGGRPEYWRTYERVLRFNSNLTGPISYSKSETGAFDRDVMDQLGDHKAIYRDGAMGGVWGLMTEMGTIGSNANAENRINAGEAKGRADAKSIIANLARDKTTGEIVETIKIITHSMGGAYGKGYLKALKAYIGTLPKEQQYQIKITLVADFDPFQAGSLKADGETPTFQFKHKGIRNILGLGFLANEDELGKVGIETNTGTSTDHSIMTFINDISKLSEGTYNWNGTNWVKQ